MATLQNRFAPLRPGLRQLLRVGDRPGDWLALLAFWLLAAVAVVASTWNLYAVTEIAVRHEQTARAAIIDGTPGKGRNADLAAHAAPPLLDPDSFCWISLVQKQVAEGNLRNRWFPYDDAPEGRAAHWSASFAWWMILCAAPLHYFGGLLWPDAIVAAAPWTNPVLFLLALAVLGMVARRRVGVWGAGVLMVTLASIGGVEWDFGFGRPDHHGLHLIAFVGMILCVLGAGLGWVRTDGTTEAPPLDAGEKEAGTAGFLPLCRPREWQAARNAFTWSAVFGAAGLWIGATQQMFFIGAVGAAAGVAAIFFVRPDETPGESLRSPVRFVPALWRDWARVGALTSLGFYLLEYFPFHFGMRLEVNHPLYALAWAGGGELIYVAGKWARQRRLRFRGDVACWTRAGVGIACLAALPAAVLFGPPTWYGVRDAVLLRIMGTVSEGQPLVGSWTPLGLFEAFWQVGPIVFALPVGLALVLVPRWRRALPPWRAMGIWVALAPAVVCLAWLFIQRRWLGLEGAAMTVLALASAGAGSVLTSRKKSGLPLLWLLLTVPAWLQFAVLQSHLSPAAKSAEMLDATLAFEEIAWNLRLDAPGDADGGRPARMVGPLGASTTLHFYGGMETVGSLYWENAAASREQIRLLADDAPGEPDARRIARERGLDYILVRADQHAVVQVQYIDRGKTDRAALPHTLVYRLANPLHPAPPDWLEPVRLLDAPVADQLGYRLYHVRRERL